MMAVVVIDAAGIRRRRYHGSSSRKARGYNTARPTQGSQTKRTTRQSQRTPPVNSLRPEHSRMSQNTSRNHSITGTGESSKSERGYSGEQFHFPQRSRNPQCANPSPARRLPEHVIHKQEKNSLRLPQFLLRYAQIRNSGPYLHLRRIRSNRRAQQRCEKDRSWPRIHQSYCGAWFASVAAPATILRSSYSLVNSLLSWPSSARSERAVAMMASLGVRVPSVWTRSSMVAKRGWGTGVVRWFRETGAGEDVDVPL